MLPRRYRAEWTRLRSRHQTMSSLNQVRFTIDTRDAEAKQEVSR
jgi:hypothetical protein